MDFELGEEHKIFQKAIRDFAEKEVAPLVEDAEKEEKFPVQLFPKMGQLGYLCISIPEKYGGPGADKITECIYIEELNRVSSGISSGIMAHSSLGTAPIYHFGTEEQRQKYLVAAVKGEKIAAFALTEPNAGSDAGSIVCKAKRVEGGYVLDGTKTFITNGTICDYAIVAAYTDPSIRWKGISLFIVDRGTPGFSVSRKLQKMGNRASETAELLFENCFVPEENLLGGKEGGFNQIVSTLKGGRIVYGARCVGVAQAAYEASLKYSKERVQFGRPIADYQAIKFKLTKMSMEIEAARLLTYKAAWLFDQGRECMKEASMVKLFGSEMAQRVTAEAMQIHGGYGYMMEHPVQRYYRDARLFTVTEGTSEIQNLIIGKEIGI